MLGEVEKASVWSSFQNKMGWGFFFGGWLEGSDRRFVLVWCLQLNSNSMRGMCILVLFVNAAFSFSAIERTGACYNVLLSVSSCFLLLTAAHVLQCSRTPLHRV